MTLIASVDEQLGGRASELDNLGRRKYVRKFWVETTDPLVGALAVRTAVSAVLGIGIGTSYSNGLPGTDARYEFDRGAFVESIAAEEYGDTGTGWVVTVPYGPFDWSPFQEEAALWPLRVSFGGERTERVVYFDKAGNPIVNSARDPFGDPVTVDDTRTALVITRNEKVSTFDLTLAETYRDKINTFAWNNFPPKVCKMGVITTSEPTYDPIGRYYYYAVTYPVMLNGDTWVKKLLDQGFNQLDSSGNPAPIMSKGEQVTDPVPLDGAGHRLPPNGTPVTLPFDVYDEVDWAGLNINLAVRLGA